MKIKYFIILILSIFLLPSCDSDFLNKNNPTQLNENEFFKNEEEFYQAVSGIYGQLQNYVAEQWKFTEFISDNTTLHFNPSDRGQAGHLERIEYWQYGPGSTNITSLYSQIYNSIMNINLVIEKLENAQINQDEILDFEGQLKFLRAFYYFDLVRFFGDVIIISSTIQSPDEAYSFSRSSVSKVYDFIIDDLKTAAKSLPLQTDIKDVEIGRVSKGAALALLGKVYLTLEQYDTAISILEEVVDMEYSLLSEYSAIFDPSNKNNSESIFEVQFKEDDDVGGWSNFLYNFYPRESYGAVIKYPGTNGGGWNIPTNDIIESYEVGDVRKEVSISEGFTNNDGEWEAIPFIKKYYYEESYSKKGRPGNNWPVLRYADVFLMLAEAINESSGPSEEVYSYINPLRERAGLIPIEGMTKESLRQAILNERRIELAFENHRWFDLKRVLSPIEMTNLLNEHGEKERNNPTTSRGPVPFGDGDYRFEEYLMLFPIPSRELRINPNINQNSGY